MPRSVITDSKGGRNSVYPAIETLTFGPWIYMVPQYRPRDVLILGYAGGTVAGLIRLIYGGVPIEGVDVEECEDYYGVKLVVADARQYVKDARHFDTVVVDLYDDGSQEPCDFVTTREFAEDLKEVANYIIVHAKESTDMSAYGQPVKVLALNDSRFHYFVVNRIDTLPIR